MKKVLIDIVPVVVGILLALFINQWRQSVSEKRFIDRSLNAISEQNKLNVRELEYSIRRQDVLIDSLRAYLKDDDLKLIDVISKAGGLYTPDLQSTTWKFLLENNNHTLVPYEYISQLATIEKYEGLVNMYNEQLLDLFFDPETYESVRLKRVMLSNLSDLQHVEKSLIKAFQKMDSLILE